MDIQINEFCYIPGYIMCPCCKQRRRTIVQRMIIIDSIVYRLRTCSNKCDALAMSHLLNMAVNSRKAFDRQETHMMIAAPKNGLQHTEAGVRLSR